MLFLSGVHPSQSTLFRSFHQLLILRAIAPNMPSVFPFVIPASRSLEHKRKGAKIAPTQQWYIRFLRDLSDLADCLSHPKTEKKVCPSTTDWLVCTHSFLCTYPIYSSNHILRLSPRCILITHVQLTALRYPRISCTAEMEVGSNSPLPLELDAAKKDSFVPGFTFCFSFPFFERSPQYLLRCNWVSFSPWKHRWDSPKKEELATNHLYVCLSVLHTIYVTMIANRDRWEHPTYSGSEKKPILKVSMYCTLKYGPGTLLFIYLFILIIFGGKKKWRCLAYLPNTTHG